MDPSAPVLVWVLTLSALSVSALLIVVAAVFAWHQRQARRQAQAWGRHLLVAQEAERGRIARELHDDVVQRLSWVMGQREAGPPAAADAMLDDVVTDLRSLAHELHPPALRHLHLGEALQDLVDRHLVADHSAVELELPPEVKLEDATAMALYRVAQEALTNIAKHAAATQVRVTLRLAPREARLEIADNGTGAGGDLSTRQGFGVRGMHERIEMLGGRLSITSRAGEGTTVAATVPVS